MTIAATVRLEESARRAWDVLIVGAGPAGALLGRQLALAGQRVLLVDKASFPRHKVCGCCLSGRALAALDQVGLGDVPRRCAAVPLHEVRLAAGTRTASLPLPAGLALSRQTLDAALVSEAIAAGADFLPETRAAESSVDGNWRTVVCRRRADAVNLAARLVVAADGLGGHFLGDEAPSMVQPHSRLGASTLAVEAPGFYRPGVVHMACGRNGYVGLVRLEDGRLDIAAALDPAAVRREAGPGRAAVEILAQTAWPPIGGLAELPWRGTPPLTRRRNRLGAARLFVVGDAAGYVEPFTGEGIAWAWHAALALTPFVERAITGWTPRLVEDWSQAHRRLLGVRRQTCRLVARALRSHLATRLVVGVLAHAPFLARPFIGRLNR